MSATRSVVRVVLDTNVFISGLFWDHGACAKILDMWTEKKIIAVTTEDTFSELEKTLSEFRIRLPKAIEDETLTRLREHIVVPGRLKPVCRDPNDDKFIAAAVGGNASHLITYDKDLLVLHSYEMVSILTPSAFLSAQII